MTDGFRAASDHDVTVLWPTVRPTRLFESREAFAAWREWNPWALRLGSHGDVVVLVPWRPHLPVLHIRAAWCPPERVDGLVADARAVGERHGLPSVLSPLLDEFGVRPYVEAGLTLERRLVAYSVRPGSVRSCDPPARVSLRPAETDDADAIASLEDACFSRFWRHEREGIMSWLEEGRVIVATEQASVIGYTLTTLSGNSGTLSRVAVALDVRGRGVGKALVAEAAAFLSQSGVGTLSLCTQESNGASRALYASLGLREHGERLVLAADPQSRDDASGPEVLGT